MTAEVLRVLQIDNGELVYTGQIIVGQTKYPITGRVPHLPTNGGIKRAIGDDIKRQIADYQAAQVAVPTTITLPASNIFKDALS
jgi:hypothetical protein